MRAALATSATLLVVYLLTLAPGVTFWDSGEFIAAANGLGIPHPPGTPLYVALGRAVIVGLGPAMGAAGAMNTLSALCTAAAAGILAWTIARELAMDDGAGWGALAGGLLAGTMFSVWSNATETEVYALALLHAALMLAAAARAGSDAHGARWLVVTAYLMSLAPAVHLSALVAAPAAVALASRASGGRWQMAPAAMLSGVALWTAGVGRISLPLVALGALLIWVGHVVGRRTGSLVGVHATAPLLAALPIAGSALLMLLIRSRLDPPLNQGDPASLAALADVVGRRQYPVAGLLPRQAPVWLQAAGVAQYVDWQVAMGWGAGIVTSAARVGAAVAYLALGAFGWRQMRRESARLASALLVLMVCGTVGVATYLNFKAGASLGWGVIADSVPHEARERDYFFVLGFVAWAALAGWGALGLARRVRRPSLAIGVALIPLVANWHVSDRSRIPDAGAASAFAVALLGAAPPRAVLFTAGDNDSYPLWYLQQVRGARRDVLLVTLPLLAAGWYGREIGRRTGWRWDSRVPVAGAEWAHELTAAGIARAALASGRPVAASPALTKRERTLLGARWLLRGPLFVARGAPDGAVPAGTALPEVDVDAARAWLRGRPPLPPPEGKEPDDVSATMLTLLECPRLGLPWDGARSARDSLETRCNFR